MLKKMRGFTLIELLIVVAIIGILAALLIPNIITALQKAKQKGTMKDITTIAGGIADYVTDRGSAPTQDGAMTDPFKTALAPMYIKVCPTLDQWGNPYMVYCGTAADQYGVTGSSADDFMIASYGRGGEVEAWTYDINNPEAGLFSQTTSADFEKDLVNWDGVFVRGPRSGATGS